jgi:predicted membrane channel-forming protein YqfA (hemolysin III family)
MAFAAIFGVMLFLLDWAGYSGKFRPWVDPRPLSEIWWHLPATAGAFFFLMTLWPWRIDLHDSI